MAKEKRKDQQQEADQDRQSTNKVIHFGGRQIKVDEEQDEETAENSRKGFSIGMLVLILVGGVLLGFLAFYIVNRTREYNDFEVLSETPGNDATRMTYEAYNDSLIKYSQEGITYLDKDGQAIWVESYKMKQPVAVVSDKYIAVADLNGNSVYIFNENGRVNYTETPYTICNIDVASQGVFAVVLENETENYIEIYDKNGQEIAKHRTTIADSGYPMDITLSNDGTKLMTSFVTVNGVTVENSIAAYNYGDVGQNAADRLVGGFNNLGDTIVPKIEFLSNDVACAFGDNQFIVYSMREKPSEKARITDFQGEIQSIFYNSKYIGVVERTSSMLADDAGDESLSPYLIRVYNTNGNLQFSKPLEFSYNYLYATEDELIVVGMSECRIYDFSGRLKFSYSFPKEVVNLIPTGNPEQYIVVFDDATEMIHLLYVEEEDTTEAQ